MRRLFSVSMLCAIAFTAYAGDTSKPEFDGYCANGLAHGHEVKTECAVLWVSPEDKVYCFDSEASKVDFMKDSQKNLRKAKAFWDDPSYWERLKKEEAS